MNPSSWLQAAIAVLAGWTAPLGLAETLASGSATVDYDEAGWGALAAAYGPSPVLTLSGFFDQEQANALTGAQISSTPQANPSYVGQVYGMNGGTVTNRTGRYTQPTTFAWEQGRLSEHTGVIGLGGVARFVVLGGTGGKLMYGDFTLQFDSRRQAVGGSGWYLRGNIPPVAPVHDLTRVDIVEGTDGFTMSADLNCTVELAELLYSTPADTLRKVGTFRFTGRRNGVPDPAPVLGITVPTEGGVTLHGSGGRPGAAFVVVASASLGIPVSEWPTVLSGTFDASGSWSATVPMDTAGPAARFHAVRVP